MDTKTMLNIVELSAETVQQRQQLERNAGYFNCICEALEIDHDSSYMGIITKIEELKDRMDNAQKAISLNLETIEHLTKAKSKPAKNVLHQFLGNNIHCILCKETKPNGKHY